MDNLIYVLIDPRTGEFRYIGMTTKGLARPKEHLGEVARGKQGSVATHKANWIRSLIRDGCGYSIGVLQEIKDATLLPKAEKKWISCYRGMGARLTNGTEGGDGLLNPSKITRKKIAKAYTGACNSSVAISKMKEALTGRRLSEEHKKKVSISLIGNQRNKGRKLSKEHRDRISAGNKGKVVSVETKLKMSAAAKKRKRVSRRKELAPNG